MNLRYNGYFVTGIGMIGLSRATSVMNGSVQRPGHQHCITSPPAQIPTMLVTTYYIYITSVNNSHITMLHKFINN
jgi:hypothetical protein